MATPDNDDRIDNRSRLPFKNPVELGNYILAGVLTYMALAENVPEHVKAQLMIVAFLSLLIGVGSRRLRL